MERDSFIFYRSFYEAISETDTDTQVSLYNAICRKALYDEDVFLEGTAKILYTLIKPQIEANSKRYEDGKKGGRPKKETTGSKDKKTTGFENKKPNNNAIDSCVDGLQEVIDFYNNNVGNLTPFGLSLLTDYVKEMGKDIVIYAMQISVEANKRTIQYIKAILNNWQKAGIKTLIEAQEESKLKAKKHSKENFNNHEQRDYGDIINNLYANEM